MDQKPVENAEQKARVFFKDSVAAWLSFFALTLASVAVAFSDISYVALPIAALLLTYVILMTRRPVPIVMAAFALTTPGFLTGNFLGGALFLSLYVALAAGSSLILLKKTPVFSLLASALAFGICALVSGGLLSRALPAVFILPAYLLMALAHARRERRSIVVLAADAGCILVVLALVVVYFFQTYGAMNRETVLAATDAFRASLLDVLKAARDEVTLAFGESGLEIPSALKAYLEDDVLKSLVQSISILLPGLAAAACGLLAFFGQSLFLSIRQNEGDEFAKTPESILFTMGIPSAAVYLVALLLTILLDSASLPYAVAENLSIILLFPFCFAGLQRVIGFLFLTPKGMRWLFLVLFFSMACCLSVGVVELLALYAAFDTVFAPIRKKILDRRKGSNDPGGTD